MAGRSPDIVSSGWFSLRMKIPDIISKLMNNAKTPIAVTGRFYHHKASDQTIHYIDANRVRELVAEQYGPDSEAVDDSPDWLRKGGTFSVRDGNVGFEEDRIAASNG